MDTNYLVDLVAQDIIDRFEIVGQHDFNQIYEKGEPGPRADAIRNFVASAQDLHVGITGAIIATLSSEELNALVSEQPSESRGNVGNIVERVLAKRIVDRLKSSKG